MATHYIENQIKIERKVTKIPDIYLLKKLKFLNTKNLYHLFINNVRSRSSCYNQQFR